MSFKILSHEVSKFGKLEIALHGKSLEFYELLESKGVISYLKRVDHLGYVSKSYPGNNHKRWDYVMLQLFLLTKLRDSVFQLGLNTKKKVGSIQLNSGLEYLQVMILFSNMGYINGTQASQLGLAKFLENEKHRDEFLSLIREKENWYKYSIDIISEKDFYSLKYVVALNFLSKNDPENKFTCLIDSYLFDETSNNLSKLKWAHHRIRKICFLYLDSYNSGFPFLFDISKLLLNPSNYLKLFNPNSTDFESLFQSLEETLTKKLYIAEKSVVDLLLNSDEYYEYLCKKKTSISLSNYLIDVIKQTDNFILQRCANNLCYQFYLEDSSISFFQRKLDLFIASKGFNNAVTKRSRYQSILNKKLSDKNLRILFLRDYNSKYSYINLLLPQKGLPEIDEKQFIHNYLIVHNNFISDHIEESNKTSSGKSFIPFFLEHYTRKVLLQLLRILFKQTEESKNIAFIDHSYKTTIDTLMKKDIWHTGYLSSKREISKLIDNIRKLDVPADIVNNYNLLSSVFEKNLRIKRNVKAFYCLIPTQVDCLKKDAGLLYNHQNPKGYSNITDIDLMIVFFNKSSYQFFLIEGKEQQKGAESAIKKDFSLKFKPLLNHSDNMPQIHYIFEDSNTKGGYICYSNI